MAKKLNEIEATQGTKRPGLIYVLGVGLILILAAFGAIWAFQGH